MKTTPTGRTRIVCSIAAIGLASAASAAPLPRQLETPGLLARMLAGPLSGVEEIVLAERAPDRDGHWYANFGYHCHDPNRYVYGPGGGKLLILNLRTGKTRTLLDDPTGAVRDPIVDYDAKRVLFSYRPGGTHQYHLYEIDVDGDDLRQITEGDFNDYEPCYLPDGGIMFCSSRCYRWVPCWYTQVGVMYRCERDGSDVRQISFGVEHENTPWMLPDGRVLYTRWEYVDRFTNGFHHLWTINPDGTAQMVYYGNSASGRLMIDAKPIPGTDKVAAIFSPGHGKSEHQGDVTVLDVRYGTDNTKPHVAPDGDRTPARQLNMIAERQINRHTRATADGKSMMAWRDVLPFNENCFLVCNQDGLYVMDGEGDFECVYRSSRAEVEYEERGRTQTHPVWVHEPRHLAPRQREPVIPDRVDYTRTTGTMVLSDMYMGRNLPGVEPGEVKELLVLEELPKPVSLNWSPTAYRTRHVGESGSIIIHRAIGTVPVEPDGSAHFEVPAQRPLFFVALDADGVALKRRQSFVSVMPGETVSCVGCHERRHRAPHERPTGTLQALRRGPSEIARVPGVPASGLIDFPRDVQPVLDKHCLRCHKPGKAKGGVRLDGARTPRWTMAYSTLIDRGQTGMAGAYYEQAKYGNMPPRSFGSPISKLIQKVRNGHGKVDLSTDEFRLLTTWIDASACFAGTYAALAMPEPSYPRFDRRRPGDSAIIQRCASCHLPKSGRTAWPFAKDSWIDLDNVERSYLVRAPLPKTLGGLGLCRQRKARSSQQAPADADARNAPVADVFGQEDEAAYAAFLDEVRSILDGTGPGWRPADVTQPAYWQEGFRPADFYPRELIRAGALDRAWRPGDPTDWFAVEHRYFHLFYTPVEKRRLFAQETRR